MENPSSSDFPSPSLRSQSDAVAPKMSISNLLNSVPDDAQPAVDPAKKFHCLACNATVMYRFRREHFKSLKHQRASGVADPVKEPTRFCEVCGKSISAHNWKAHEQGVTHQELVGVAEPVPTKMRMCEVCGFGVTAQNWKRHVRSGAHVGKVEVVEADRQA
jgi:RNA polymerase subunit RPABC4/transcription elongation factor Spt4